MLLRIHNSPCLLPTESLFGHKYKHPEIVCTSFQCKVIPRLKYLSPQVKYCVLLMPSGALKITGGDIPDNVKSDKQVEDEEVRRSSAQHPCTNIPTLYARLLFFLLLFLHAFISKRMCQRVLARIAHIIQAFSSMPRKSKKVFSPIFRAAGSLDQVELR
jgi:hypothetical protein